MQPPRRPNEPPERQKESVANMQMVDDMTLFTFISVLFAMLQYFAHMNKPQCTC